MAACRPKGVVRAQLHHCAAPRAPFSQLLIPVVAAFSSEVIAGGADLASQLKHYVHIGCQESSPYEMRIRQRQILGGRSSNEGAIDGAVACDNIPGRDALDFQLFAMYRIYEFLCFASRFQLRNTYLACKCEDMLQRIHSLLLRSLSHRGVFLWRAVQPNKPQTATSPDETKADWSQATRRVNAPRVLSQPDLLVGR